MKKKILVPLDITDEKLIPVYASEDASGADLKAAIDEEILLNPGESCLVPTGVKLAIPQGYEMQVRPRSGLACKHQITIVNTPGTIDADYRGEIGVILINHGKQTFTITPYMRIAQLVLAPIAFAQFTSQSALNLTERGEGGFGHSGTHEL